MCCLLNYSAAEAVELQLQELKVQGMQIVLLRGLAGYCIRSIVQYDGIKRMYSKRVGDSVHIFQDWNAKRLGYFNKLKASQNAAGAGWLSDIIQIHCMA